MAKPGKVNRTSHYVHDIERPIRWRKYQRFLLIVCEDSKTEPFYFNKFKDLFPEETLFLKTVGTGRDPKGVIDQAIKERENLAIESNKPIDEVWAVFDKDDADLNASRVSNWNQAFEIASTSSIQLAYSNEVFELWLLLHFRNVDSAIALTRTEIYAMLETSVRQFPGYDTFEYKHGNEDVVEITFHIGSEVDAILRAKELKKSHDDQQKEPMNSNPCTMVYLLVIHLRELIKFYNQGL